MVEYGYNVGNALANFQAPSTQINPQQLSGGATGSAGFWDKFKTGAGNAISEENIGSTGMALNLLGKMFGADPNISGPVDQFGQSMIADQAAKAGKKESQDMFQQLIKALSGGNPTAEGTGGLTSIGMKPGKEPGSIVGTAVGDITTPTKKPTASMDDMISKQGGLFAGEQANESDIDSIWSGVQKERANRAAGPGGVDLKSLLPF